MVLLYISIGFFPFVYYVLLKLILLYEDFGMDTLKDLLLLRNKPINTNIIDIFTQIYFCIPEIFKPND